MAEYISLSSAQQIQHTVAQNVGGISFVDTLGSFINNREFSDGYLQYSDGAKNSRSYAWEALSAIGQDLTESVYSNVINYVNNVSNVDTCKIRALRSMMQFIGMNYSILEKTDYYPLEIVGLLDILSIHRKHLLNNKYIKQDFIDCLSSDGIISSGARIISSGVVLSGNPELALSCQNYVYDSSTFSCYLSSIFYNFIESMLNMSMQLGDGTEKLVKNCISACDYGSSEEYIEDVQYTEFKVSRGIDKGFNQDAIANNIDIGLDSLSNYQGYQRELLELVISNRAKPLAEAKYQPETKFFYYKKQKVIEYARFIDNTYSTLDQLLSNDTYDFDPNYFILKDNKQKKYVLDVADERRTLDTEMIRNVASTLTHMAEYISRIREKIRLQVRKVFMKGTDNLLTFTVSEFINDYIDKLKQNVDNDISGRFSDEERKYFYNVYDAVKNTKTDVKDRVIVQEYFDETEYMNLQTATTAHAANRGNVNERFFDRYFTLEDGTFYVKDPKHFTTDQIDSFYLNRLGMKNYLSENSETDESSEKLKQSFYSFLSVLFDIGANTSYYNEQLSVFGSKLTDGTYSTEKYEELMNIISVRQRLDEKKAYLGGYEFDQEQVIADQKEDFIGKYETELSGVYLSAVSVNYDAYIPTLDDLSSQTQILRSEFENYLSGKYFYYFAKSKNEYCLEDDGSYTLDYFIGNDQYPADDVLFTRYGSAWEWIKAKNHCRNWPVLCASTKLKNYYVALENDIETGLTRPLQLSGYNKLDIDDLGGVMDSVRQFLDGKIAARNQYLSDSLENLRTQANALKAAYDGIEGSVNGIVARSPGIEQGFYLEFVGADYNEDDGWTPLGEYELTSTPSFKNPGKVVDDVGYPTEYDKFSGKYFVEYLVKKDGEYVHAGLYDKRSISFDASADLKSRVESLINVFGANIFYGENAANNSDVKTALESALQSLENMSTQIDAIIDQIQKLFNITGADWIKTENTTDALIDRIQALIKFVGTEISEAEFAKDTIISSYNAYYKDLTQISSAYVPHNDQYKALWTQFYEYLNDYITDNSTSYQTYSDTNLIKIYNYTIKQDEANRQIIDAWFADFDARYFGVIEQFNDLIASLATNEVYFRDSSNKDYIYEFYSDTIEECISDMTQMLLLDVLQRTLEGQAVILGIITEFSSNIFDTIVELYFKYLRDTIGKYDIDTDRAVFEEDLMALSGLTWDDLGKNLYEKLEYRDDVNYVQSHELFKSYSGVVEASVEGTIKKVAYDPYYNHKNLTHPSYQVHPFMWNFVEKIGSNTIADDITKYITDLDYYALEEPYVTQRIDDYIGECGNAIRFWINEPVDYSGWAARYETSDHYCRATNISSEVVDYDGAFYPPALEAYLAGATTIQQLDRYYSHLQYGNSEHAINKVNKCLSSNLDVIRDIAAGHLLSAVYDIYRYQTDAWGNMYVLYKQYGKENPTEREKLETVGRLWIRLADNPIAFPYEDVIVMDEDTYTPLYEKTLKICDILVTGTKDRIVLTHAGSDETMRSICLYLQYENPNGLGIGDLKITNFDLDDADRKQSEDFPQHDTSGVQLKYVGAYNYKNNLKRTDVVYVRGTGVAPGVSIYKVNTNSHETGSEYLDLSQYEVHPYSGGMLPVISYWCDYNATNYLDIAYVTSKDMSLSVQVYKDRLVDADTNSPGTTFDDFSTREMNSHDILNQNVTLVRHNLDLPDRNVVRKYNFNSDLGYIPAYPGIEDKQPLDIRNELSDNYQSLELLGTSKNLDPLIEKINTAPNPYLTKEEIREQHLFGRVYEDFNLELDNSLNIFSNRAFYGNMAQTNEFSKEEYLGVTRYRWLVDLSAYRRDQLSCLKVIAYSTTSLGRNPYIIDDLSNVMLSCVSKGSSELIELSANYSDGSQYGKAEYQLTSTGGVFKFVGTCNGINDVNAFFDNKLPNIERITYTFADQAEHPSFMMYFWQKTKNRVSYIPDGTVKIALINTRDFSVLEDYHYLDTNNFIHRGDPDNQGEGAYYIDQDGNQKYLSSVHLSSYTDSKNIYALATYHRLQFKYGEEDIFYPDDLNYYFPCLNVKLPYTYGQYYNDNFLKVYEVIDEDQFIKIFENDEQYAFYVQNENCLSQLQDVQIENVEQQDMLRVYEDFLSTYVDDDGQEYYISEKYAEVDPQLYQYVHFYSDVTGSDTNENGTVVPTDAMSCVYIDLSSNNDKFSRWLYKKNLKCLRSEDVAPDRGKTSVKFSYSDLSEEQKTQFKENMRKFLRLYVSYIKNEGTDGIDLYVNYQNFINSPYVKIEDGRILADTIEGTYAVVRQDESATISLIVQICAYQGTELFGVKNVTVAQFQIQNISDDKPKFILRRIKDIDSSQFSITEIPYIRIEGERKNVLFSQKSDTFEYDVTLNANYNVPGTVSCSMQYDDSILRCLTNSDQCVQAGEGWLKLYFAQYNRVARIEFQAKDMTSKPFMRALNKVKVLPILDEYSQNDGNEISVVNGYVRMSSTEKLQIPAPTLRNNAVFQHYGTASSFSYDDRPSVADIVVKDSDGYELKYGVDYSVSYENCSGVITIEETSEDSYLYKSASPQPRVIVTALVESSYYQGQSSVNYDIWYQKEPDVNILGNHSGQSEEVRITTVSGAEDYVRTID